MPIPQRMYLILFATWIDVFVIAVAMCAFLFHYRRQTTKYYNKQYQSSYIIWAESPFLISKPFR